MAWKQSTKIVTIGGGTAVLVVGAWYKGFHLPNIPGYQRLGLGPSWNRSAVQVKAPPALPANVKPSESPYYYGLGPALLPIGGQYRATNHSKGYHDTPMFAVAKWTHHSTTNEWDQQIYLQPGRVPYGPVGATSS